MCTYMPNLASLRPEIGEDGDTSGLICMRRRDCMHEESITEGRKVLRRTTEGHRLWECAKRGVHRPGSGTVR